MSSPTRRTPPWLRLLPDLAESAATGRAANRLVDVATRAVCRAFDVPQWIAVSAMHSASRAAVRPLRDVAAGVLLSERLPPALVDRVRHGGFADGDR